MRSRSKAKVGCGPTCSSGGAEPCPRLDRAYSEQTRPARTVQSGSAGDGVVEITMCSYGERAMSAASLAERAGLEVAVFVGGTEPWVRRSGNALVRERR